MNKEIGIGKSTPEMEKYLTPDANAFFGRVYNAIGTNTLHVHSGGSESNPVRSVEKIFYALNHLVPNADDVVSALELMATLPENSIHHRIAFSHIIKHPEYMLKLAKNRNEVYSLIKELDAKECRAVGSIGGNEIENYTFQVMDNLIKLANDPYKTKVVDIVGGLKQRGINACARYYLDNGFLEKPSLIDGIHREKDAFFKGIDTLTKIGYIEYAKKNGNETVWGTISSSYKELIALGKNDDFQALLIGLKELNLFEEGDLINHHAFFTLKHFAKHQKELLEFIKEYNSILGRDNEICWEHNGLHYSALNEIAASPRQTKRFIKVLKNKNKSLDRVRTWCNPKTRRTTKDLRDYLINFGQKEALPPFGCDGCP